MDALIALIHAVLARRVIRFLIVASTSASVYFVVLYGLEAYVEIPASVASAVSYALAVPVNFFGHKLFTYGSSGQVAREIIPYIALQFANVVLSGLVMKVAVDVFGAPVIVGGVFVLVTIAATSFLVMLRIFKPAK